MSENVRKLVGVVVMAVLVVVGVAVSSGDDTNFTRNSAFVKLGDFQQLPEAEQARLAPAFVEQAAPKSSIQSTGAGSAGRAAIMGGEAVAGGDRYDVVPGGGGIGPGKASVLEGKGVDGKGGTSSFFSRGLHNNGAISGSSGTAGSLGLKWREDGAGRVVSGQDIEAIGGVEGVADRIQKWSRGGTDSIAESVCKGKVHSLKNVLVTSYTDSGRVTYIANDGAGGCPDGYTWKVEEGEALKVFPKVEMREAELLAECMDSKVGDVFLKSHIESSATDCIATVLPTALPDRAKQLGTYWQTQQQLLGDGTVRF